MGNQAGWPPRFLTKPKTKTTAGPEMIEFIEAYCRITKDTVSGNTGDLIVLRPWQRNLMNLLFTLRKDGSYQYRTALVGLPASPVNLQSVHPLPSTNCSSDKTAVKYILVQAIKTKHASYSKPRNEWWNSTLNFPITSKSIAMPSKYLRPDRHTEY